MSAPDKHRRSSSFVNKSIAGDSPRECATGTGIYVYTLGGRLKVAPARTKKKWPARLVNHRYTTRAAVRVIIRVVG